MSRSISRRTVLMSAVLPGCIPALRCARAANEDAMAQLAALEVANGGRLGVAILDTAGGSTVAHRGEERFAMCSTFKFLAVAAVLLRVDRGEERLDRKVVFGEKDLVTYSPLTKNHVGSGGMALGYICEAALTLSDNTAGNLLLANIGGPAGLTAFARSLGDSATRLDRIETEVNEATPGDPRDTTTPLAMLENLHKITTGEVLSSASRERLLAWLVANKTGDKRLRAGLPGDWKIGDKTGGGNNGALNDIAIVTPPNRKPILVAAYYAESSAPAERRDAVLAEIGKIVTSSVS